MRAVLLAYLVVSVVTEFSGGPDAVGVQMKVLWLLSIRQRYSCTVNCETEKGCRRMG